MSNEVQCGILPDWRHDVVSRLVNYLSIVLGKVSRYSTWNHEVARSIFQAPAKSFPRGRSMMWRGRGVFVGAHACVYV